MRMSKEINQGYEVVTLTGFLDIETVEEMKADFETLAGNAQLDVVLDMTGVTFIDSSGVGALVFTFKRLKTKGVSLHLVGLNKQPLKLIKLLRIDRTMPTYARIEELFDITSDA